MPIENKSTFTGLILVSGEDRPGITESLMKTLSAFSVTIIDIEQLVIRDRLLLTVLLSLDEAHAEAITEDLHTLQDKIGLDIAIDFTQQGSTRVSGETLRVVIVGNAIKPSGLAAVASQIAQLGGNISAIKRTAMDPLISIELELSIPNNSLKEVQGALTSVAIENKIDLAVEPGGLQRKSKRIVMLDMDSTLIEQEVINLLGAAAGQSIAIEAITHKAMAGDLDFKAALIERVALLKGMDQNILNQVRDQITLTKGAKKLIDELHQQGHKVGVVSGGFIEVIEPILNSLSIDFYRANKLKISDGLLTGEIEGPLIDSHAKRIALEQFAKQEKVPLEQTVAIGDGANDLEMIKAAGLGIAFNAKPKVAAAADTTISNQDLSTVLLLMGISI
ncbi:phosphoserine phosphatase [Candidatus Nanopelagicus limnes]|uniref:phosphoserine phosphatase n=1 Tax=Candidatus Nanopelagicus limnae TaxID=1884634 RepID=A0A249JXT8_9ACTN|nr:phosphoserine phosphatase SerB [Candidatus Nanopelagicus limnes]ASY09353.1 phosphoserine phosphatase [Candidatus Nanopelagicus limnes]